MYVVHRDAIIGRLIGMLTRGPPKPGGVGREGSVGQQRQMLEQIRAHAEAIGQMIKEGEGERNQMEESGMSDEDDEDRDVGFDTSDLSRTIEMVSLTLPPGARPEFLELMRMLYHRFHLVKMESDAVQEALLSERDEMRQAIKSLLQDRSILRSDLGFRVYCLGDLDSSLLQDRSIPRLDF